MSVVDKHLPFKKRRIKMNSEQCINDQILSEMQQRDYLHNKALKTNNEHDWKLYKAARNRAVAIIKEVKRNFVKEAINQAESKPKDMWTRLKQFLPSKSNTSTLSYLEVDGESVTSNDKI